MAIAGLLLLALAAAQPRVYVEPGELAQPLREALLLELGGARLTESSTAADLRCRFMRAGGDIFLELEPRGEPRAIRRELAPANADPTATVRIAVVLILRTLEQQQQQPQQPPPEEPTPPEETPPGEPRASEPPEEPPDQTPEEAPQPEPAKPDLELGATLRMSASLWQRPLTPRLGPELSIWLERDTLSFALDLGVQGLPCCNASDRIEVDANELIALLEVGLAIWRTDTLELTARIAGGARWLRGESRSLIFQATGTTEDVSLVAATLRAGGELSFALSEKSRLRLALGLVFFAGDHQVDLPPPYRVNEPAFDAGTLAPWLALGFSYSLF